MEHKEEIAEAIKEIARDEDLTIDEIRELIRVEDERAQRKCFGTIWVGPKNKKGKEKIPERDK